MNKIFYLILLVSSCLFSQTSDILVLRPNGTKFKKIEMSIKTGINDNIKVKSIIPSSETQIANSISASAPKLIVAIDAQPIKMWRKIQQKNQNMNPIPSILIEDNFSDYNLNNNSNTCIISYETKLEHYIDRAVQLTGKKPNNVGVIYSSKSNKLLQSYQNESTILGVNLHGKSIIISDPENSIKDIVKGLTNHYNVDFIILLDDQNVINSQNISTIWLSLLTPLKIPVAIPSEYLYELEPRIGSFAIQPHYSEIGQIAASVINTAEKNDWVVKHKTISTDKSIYFFRNKDGSISKQNLLENDIVATYYTNQPKPSSNIQIAKQETADKPTVTQQTPAETVTTSNVPQEIVLNNVSPDKPEETIKTDSSSDTVTGNDKSITEEPPVTVAVSDKKQNSASSKKSKKDENKTETKTKHKNDKSESKRNSKTVEKHSPQPVVVSVVSEALANKEVNLAPEATSDHANYEIVITTKATNIYKGLAPDFPILGIGRSGDTLEVTSEDSSWYCVNFFGISGFLSKSDARVLTEEKPMDRFSELNYLSLTIVILCLIAISLLILKLKKMTHHNKMFRNSCLFISKKNKLLKYSNSNNKHISFIKYLKNYGFQVKNSRALNRASDFLLFNLPDLICVDWQFDPNIQDKISEMLKERMISSDFILIFYNVTDFSNLKKYGYFEDRTFYFNKKITVSEIHKILLMIKPESSSQNLSTDQFSSCLEGKISEDALTEIMQMMEVNKKTGCLLAEHHNLVGILFFENGIITYATANSHIGKPAVFEILSMKHGKFQFIPNKKPLTEQMQLSIMTVLMERAQIDDEKVNDDSSDQSNLFSDIDTF